MVKAFIFSKKKLINIHQLYKSWTDSHVFDTSNFSLNIGPFFKALHFLQFDILNME